MKRTEVVDSSDLVSNWVAGITTAWLLAGYILPNTLFDYLSPMASIDLLGLCSKHASIIALGLIAVIGSCLYLWSAAGSGAKCLCAATCVLGGLFAVQAILLRGQENARSADCLAAALAFSVAVFGARLCGRPSVLAAALCVVSSAQAAYTILYYFLGTNSMTSGVVERAGGTFGRPNYIYVIMLCGVPLTAALLVKATSWWKLFWGVCTLLMFTALVLTWYRGGLLGLAVGGGWMAFRLMKGKGLAVLATALLFGLFATSLYVRTSGPVNQRSSSRSLIGRDVLWRAGWDEFLRHPMTGVGVGRLRLTVTNSNGDEADYRQPQNIEIFWLAEMGLPGGLFLLFFVWNIFRVVRDSGTPIAIGIGAAWLALLVAGQSDTTFGTTDRVSSFALLGALLGATVLLPVGNRPAATAPERDLALDRNAPET